MQLTDSHAHLCMKHFERDREAVIERAHRASVTRIVNIAAEGDLETVSAGFDLVTSRENIWLVAGFHPHCARQVTDDKIDTLNEWLQKDRVVAVGETGLDYHYMYSPVESQQQVFRKLIRLARQNAMPIVVHTREADLDCERILREEQAEEVGGVIHCFSSSRRLAASCLSLGFYLSFSGMVTYPFADEIREVVRMTPLERILIETDSPYLSPIPKRGRRNEPAHVRFTAQKIAELKGVDIEEIAEHTTANTMTLFRLS